MTVHQSSLLSALNVAVLKSLQNVMFLYMLPKVIYFFFPFTYNILSLNQLYQITFKGFFVCVCVANKGKLRRGSHYLGSCMHGCHKTWSCPNSGFFCLSCVLIKSKCLVLLSFILSCLILSMPLKLRLKKNIVFIYESIRGLRLESIFSKSSSIGQA